MVLLPALGHRVEGLRLPAVVLFAIDRLWLRCSRLRAVCAEGGCRQPAVAAVSCAPHGGCRATRSTRCYRFLQIKQLQT